MANTPDILKTIVAHKRDELAAARSATPLAEMKSRIADLEDQPRGFERALRDAVSSGWTAVIAEVKKGSPSKGIIRPDFDPIAIAETYEANGAACLSVLTDERFFYGSLRYLGLIREQCRLPLLRKDFLFDPYHVYEARAFGADALLLIAAMLEKSRIEDLAGLAGELSLDVLLEVHDEKELAVALDTGCSLIGVNNRNLRTFVTDLDTTARLAALVPDDRLLVTESGIKSRRDVEFLAASGARAFLVGESLMSEADPGQKLQELLGT